MESLDEARKAVKEARHKVESAVEASVSTVAAALKDGIKQARSVCADQAAKAEEIMEIGSSHLQSTELLAFSKLRGTRAAIYRSTVGRLQGAEGVIRSCKSQAESLKSVLEQAKTEGKALSETKAAALQKLQEARAVLRSTSSQLEQLGAKASSAEAQAASAIKELRRLRGPDALHLRMEIAEYKALLAKEANSIQRDYNQLLRKALV